MAKGRKSLASSIAADKEALRKLQVRIAAKSARLDKVNRAMDTRRKILIGAWVLDGLEKLGDDTPWASVKDHLQDLRGFVTEKNVGLFPEFFDAEPIGAKTLAD